MICVWASMSPGMRVLPPPLIRVTEAPEGSGMADVDIFLIVFPSIRTLEVAESLSELPLKISTFSIMVTVGLF